MPSELVGLDTNIICYAFDPAFPEHEDSAAILKKISPEFQVVVNPTVIHETYHTLVHKLRWVREDASGRLLSLLRRKNVVFCNQTKMITRGALFLANKYKLGGRDSLILSNYLISKVGLVYSHDEALVKFESIVLGERKLRLVDPL